MSLPLEKLSDLTPRHTIDIERPWFSPEPSRQVALETLAEYFAASAPSIDNATVNAALAEDPEASRLAIGVNDGDGKLPAAQLPDEIDARVQVLSGTDAALATELLALGEFAAPTDGAWIRKGDGVTPGGEYVGRPAADIGPWFVAANVILGTDGTGALAGTATELGTSISFTTGNGGNAPVSGSGLPGTGGSFPSTLRLFSVVQGNGGNANGDFNSGTLNGYNGSTSNNLIRFRAGNAGSAGAGGNGGNGGGVNTAFAGVARFEGGNGGTGGSTSGSGGNGGSVAPSAWVLSFVAGNGGNGDAANGGAGGAPGRFQAHGGNGGNASGASAGGAGGAGGVVNTSGSNASGTTAGAAGGSITTTANGNRAGGSITTAAGASFAGGSIDLSNGGNTLTIRGTAGQIGHRVAVPANSAASGLVGQWASDDNYVYFYGATGWRRVAGATF